MPSSRTMMSSSNASQSSAVICPDDVDAWYEKSRKFIKEHTPRDCEWSSIITVLRVLTRGLGAWLNVARSP
ncbi:hypothetical protein Plhal304r1_c005g0021071 [Plasmopara halstedii]